MKEMQHISEVILDIEREMVSMWLMGETTHIMEHDPEWFNSLSIKDFDVVEDWFDKEDLDIRRMLLDMDDLVFDNPKDEHDFNEAMNGYWK